MKAFRVIFILKLFLLSFSFAGYSQCVPTVTPFPVDNIGITNVKLYSLNNTSAAMQGYMNFTALPAPQLIAGQSYMMSVTIGLNPSPVTITDQELLVMVDWDLNGDFTGPSETIIYTFGLGPLTTENFLLTVPPATPNGLYRLRVMGTGTGFISDECTQTGGDVEDYTLQVVSPFPMTYQSSTSSQASSPCVRPGSSGVGILLVEVETAGTTSPLTVTQVNFNTTGTTSTADISAARLFYLGIDPFGAPVSVFGSTPTPSGAFSITGSTALSVGKNYFLLAYDLSAGAGVGNLLDAQVTNVVYSSPATTVTPTVTSPAGAETIDPGTALLYTKRTAMWYLGDNIGLDFKCSSPPTPTDNSKASFGDLEGTASMCDVNGNLLFYAFHNKVYNRFHGQMPNGSGLLTNFNSSQAFLPVPDPANPNRYYLFAVNTGPAGGFSYSVIDMTLDGGNGDIMVATKNTLISALPTEHMTAVNHCNGTDTWVIAHNATTFFAVKVSAAGVSAPVTSVVPPTFTASGQMMASPDGLHIAISRDNGAAKLYSFNNETGKVCHKEDLSFGGYGCAFSNNGKYLYVNGNFTGAYQYDVSAAMVNPTAIKVYDPFIGGVFIYSTMHPGPDGKLYMFGHSRKLGSVINSPNSAGLACGFSAGSYPLSNKGRPGKYGGPNYNQSWFLDPSFVEPTLAASFTYSTPCFPTAVSFTDVSTYSLECPEYSWNFGDPASGPSNTSTLANPSHVFSGLGTFNVTMTIRERCKISTIIIPVTPDPCVLPVKLVHFDVIQKEAHNDVVWTTFSESNSKVFEVERSKDGTSFTRILSTNAAGFSTTPLNYLELDNAPLPGISYYRLKQIDNDGNFEYSNIVSVERKAGEELFVLPNPFSNKFEIVVKGEITEVKIVDILGKEVSFLRDHTIIDLENYASGVYTLIVKTKTAVLTKKVIKN